MFKYIPIRGEILIGNFALVTGIVVGFVCCPYHGVMIASGGGALLSHGFGRGLKP